MRLLLTFIVFLSIAVKSFACDCEWAGDFLTAGIEMDLVVKVKILDHIKGDPDVQQTYPGANERMVVQIIRVFKGQKTRDTITVWGDNGGLCRPYVNYFKKDQEYFLALNKMADRDEYYQSELRRILFDN